MTFSPNQKAQLERARAEALENTEGVNTQGLKDSSPDSLCPMTPQ